jgi:hypothetical protein
MHHPKIQLKEIKILQPYMSFWCNDYFEGFEVRQMLCGEGRIKDNSFPPGQNTPKTICTWA